jgi:TonB family protein
MDAVSEVLSARAAGTDGLGSMLGASVVAHLAAIGVIFLMPGLFGPVTKSEPEVVMQISLGGAVGPRDGGLATLGGRPIQEVAEAKKTIEPVRPPAAKTPEMIEPTKAPPRKVVTNKVEAKDPRSRTPTKGAQVQQGSTVAETGGKGQGFGLSSGGGGTGGYLDVANFCCPDYLATMLDVINRNWSSKQQASGTTMMRFVIQRDGRVADVLVEKSSGNPSLDFLASRALQLSRLPPLPVAFTEPALTVHLGFDYTR